MIAFREIFVEFGEEFIEEDRNGDLFVTLEHRFCVADTDNLQGSVTVGKFGDDGSSFGPFCNFRIGKRVRRGGHDGDEGRNIPRSLVYSYL